MIVKEASLAYLFYFSKKCNSGNVRNTAPSLNREGPSLSIHSNTQHKNSANNDSHTGFTGVQPKPSSKEKKKKKKVINDLTEPLINIVAMTQHFILSHHNFAVMFPIRTCTSYRML